MTLSNGNINGITAIGDDGLGQQPWWVEQWMELINGYRFKKRLERAWGYAREGHVTSIRFEGRRVHARVQGTDEAPYKVKLWLDVLNDEDWGYVLEALTQKARWSAQLLAGIMPSDIERAFAASGKRLFPFKLQEVRSECSCPDKANPCKHISAVYFLMGDRFSEDPFVLFQLRGRNRARLLEDLAEHRRKALAERAAAAKDENKASTSEEATPLPSSSTQQVDDVKPFVVDGPSVSPPESVTNTITPGAFVEQGVGAGIQQATSYSGTAVTTSGGSAVGSGQPAPPGPAGSSGGSGGGGSSY